MSDIINVAKILSYTYTSGGRVITGPSKEAAATNQYGSPVVELIKQCIVKDAPTATAADLNETITLRYTVKNSSPADIAYTTITILDPILTNTSITIVGNETGGSHAGNIITVSLPTGGLARGQSAIYSIDIKVVSPSALNGVLATGAAGTFTSTTGSINYDDDTCSLGYQHAELRIRKENNPKTLVTTDSIIEYVINIENIGNVSATIAAGAFEDNVPAGTTFVAITEGIGVIQNTNGKISNLQPMILGAFGEANSKVQFKFTVRVNAQ